MYLLSASRLQSMLSCINIALNARINHFLRLLAAGYRNSIIVQETFCWCSKSPSWKGVLINHTPRINQAEQLTAIFFIAAIFTVISAIAHTIGWNATSSWFACELIFRAACRERETKMIYMIHRETKIRSGDIFHVSHQGQEAFPSEPEGVSFNTDHFYNYSVSLCFWADSLHFSPMWLWMLAVALHSAFWIDTKWCTYNSIWSLHGSLPLRFHIPWK